MDYLVVLLISGVCVTVMKVLEALVEAERLEALSKSVEAAADLDSKARSQRNSLQSSAAEVCASRYLTLTVTPTYVK
jgi:hypothetical protein